MTYACADCPVPGTCIGKGLPSCAQVKRDWQAAEIERLRDALTNVRSVLAAWQADPPSLEGGWPKELIKIMDSQALSSPSLSGDGE